MRSLTRQMNALVDFIKDQFAACEDKDNAHSDICRDTADKFDLWEEERDMVRYPLWLCRVVEGVRIDLDNGE